MTIGAKNVYLIALVLAVGLIFFPNKSLAISKSYEPAATSSEVVVVYNSSYTTDSDVDGVQDSLQIANYYKAARSIPDANIIGLAATTTTEEMSRALYISEIKTPLEAALASAGIASSTKYIVLIKGIPLKIIDSNPATGYQGTPGVSDYSSVDAAVCLLSQSYSSTQTISNPYYGDPGTSKDYRFKNGFYSNASAKLNYLVTRLDGRTLSDVKSIIDRSVAAGPDTNRAWLLDDNAGGNFSNMDQMSTTYTTLKSINQNVTPDPWSDSTFIIGTSTLPVIGYTSYGIHAGPGSGGGMPQNYYSTTLNQLAWAPGAVSVTYESFNAFGMKAGAAHNDQGQLADFITVGGSGGIGNVYEPWSSAIAKEHIWAPAYARGYAWADAAYMSMAIVDWVSVVLGDPLMTINDNQGPDVSNFSATLNSNNKIALSWVNPAGDFSTTTIVRSASAYPANVSDGTTVYSGVAQTYTDTSVSPGTTYYYRAFAVDVNGNYGSALTTKQTVSTKFGAGFLLSGGSVAESSGLSYSIRINFASSLSSAHTLTLATSGTAIEGVDYSVSSTTVNTVVGQTYLIFQVTPLNDLIDDGDRTLILAIPNDDYWLPTTYTSYTLTITDNDVGGLSLSSASISLTEGQTATSTIVLLSQPTNDVVFDVATSTLYSLSTLTLTFTSGNWNVAQNVVITAINDYVALGNSTSTINIVASSVDSVYNATTTSVSLVVAENDVVGIGTDTSSDSVREGESGEIKINLLAQPSASVTVNIIVGSGVSISSTQLTFTVDNWATQQTVGYTATNNSLVDGSRSVTVTMSSVSTDSLFNNLSKTFTVNVTDDEVAPASGGGGGGGGAGAASTSTSVPTNILAVNQSLTIEGSVQAGSISKNFVDSTWVKLDVPKLAVSSKTTFNIVNLETFQVDLPQIVNPVNNELQTIQPLNNMIIEVVAKDITNKQVEKFSKDLSLVIYLPQMASDDKNLNLYYLNEQTKRWVLVSSAMFDNKLKTVSFSVDHLTKFAVFKNTEQKNELTISSETIAEAPIDLTNSTVTTVVTKSNTKVKIDKVFAAKQQGKILLQVEDKGRAWYVNPKNSKRYYMANGAEAFKIMRALGVGITNANLNKLKQNKALAKKQAGKILLQVEARGEAYYVNADGSLYYLKNGAEAYNVMRKLGKGIKTSDLYKIEEATAK
jgi:uncharacterized protein (TIGR03790 family)